MILIASALTGCSSAGNRLIADGHTTPASNRGSDEAEEKRLEKLAEAHAHYAAGVIADMNERSDTAVDEFYKAATQDPDNENLTLDLSRKLLQRRQPEKALDLLTSSSQRPKASGAIFAQLGFVLAHLGKADQAMAANRTAIKRDPRSIAGYQNLYLNLSQNKKNDEALKVLDQAAGRSDVSAEFLIAVSELYQNLAVQVPAEKDTIRAKAVTILTRAEKITPENSSLRLRLADGFAALGDQKRAAQLYLSALKSLPDVPLLRERIHARLTDIYLHDKDHKRAMEQLEAIVKDDPTNPQAYYFLGSIALEENHFAEAADHFSKVILLNKNFEQAYYDLALAQLSLNKANDALATLDSARKKFSENFITEFWTAMAYSHQKDHKSALRYFTAAEIIARASDPKRLNKEFYFQIGAASERTGDFPQAEKYFEKCLEVAPDFSEAMNYLGYMWAERGTNLDRAKDLIEKAVKAEPKNAAYLDSLGWVYYKLDKPKEGLDYILKAVELSEEPDATLYDHLGDVYAALNQADKAREAWQKSLSLEVKDEVRKKLEAKSQK